ncbi:helix-turn-helix domain-containing protein [Nocardia sp. NPDC004068]|uniref:helix-turn-helix domain-containing protein n=1 Tax=Nocardia sp. NPDC004068 TaxID=3364303 RepID=UPI00369D923F
MGSTLASRALGRQLQKFRERADVSKNSAAKAAETSPQTYGRLEDGVKHNATNMQINALCDKLKVSDDERRLLLALGEEVRKERKSDGKWWRAYIDGTQVDFDHYLSLEQSALRKTTVQIGLLPGLLQTAAYRRQLAWSGHPTWTSEDVERRVTLLTIRQERLSDPDFEYETIIPEWLLRQRTGGPGVMGDQLRHLLTEGERPNVSIRVLPLDATDPIVGIASSFVLLEFGPLPFTKLIEPPVVFVEGFTGALYLETKDHLDPYKDALVRAQRVALDTTASNDLIRRVLRECYE